MSMSRACDEIERNPGEWYCIVADDEYDYDYHSGCNIYGPVATPEGAFELMLMHESNPGQDGMTRFADLTPEKIALVDKQLALRRDWEARGFY